MSVSENEYGYLLKMPVFLQTALSVQTHVVDGLTFGDGVPSL
jgi:hypothetical protein